MKLEKKLITTTSLSIIWSLKTVRQIRKNWNIRNILNKYIYYLLKNQCKIAYNASLIFNMRTFSCVKPNTLILMKIVMCPKSHCTQVSTLRCPQVLKLLARNIGSYIIRDRWQLTDTQALSTEVLQCLSI